jgi:hypothetical protein
MINATLIPPRERTKTTAPVASQKHAIASTTFAQPFLLISRWDSLEVPEAPKTCSHLPSPDEGVWVSGDSL